MKTHYVVLDGLRGLASVMVVVFHLFEAFAVDSRSQVINHGYLAVDFFFLLSGFVVAYAYDDRWGSMTRWGFCKRRLIRLQPMVIIGSVIGAALFAFQHFPIFPQVAGTPAWQVALAMLAGFVMLPLPKSADIRGWQEAYPLNGPAWSLFYEYVANILYAAGVRKLSDRGLAVLVALGAFALVGWAVFGRQGDVIGGWSLDAAGIQLGLTRVLFPFFAGVLLMRRGTRIRARNPFLLCSVLLVAALSLPRMGGAQVPWLNGVYEAGCILVLFPLIVAIGAGQQGEEGLSPRLARWFGDISYPLYITHYPLMYIYTGWVRDSQPSTAAGALAGAAVLAASIALAWACLRFYDMPVRRLLAARFLPERR